MKSTRVSNKVESTIFSINANSKKALINSLSPNFFYTNKSGCMVTPKQNELY